MENRNVIETEEVGNHGQIAQLSTTTMSDGTKMQNVCFGKILKV